MHANDLKALPWFNKISHFSQVGGIETSVLDNGPGRGSRIAWVNTGSGLRFKILPDRAMDISDAFYNGHSLAWISSLGNTGPQPSLNKGVDWLKNFGGGLMTTCGLTHAGIPDTDESGERGLHGPVSNIPADIESVIQPDPVNGRLQMSMTGTIKETQIFGPSLELKRTISATLGESYIIIKDIVTNIGNTVAPHMLLYHLNFGWPLVDKGTQLIWEGAWTASNELKENKIFREGNDFRTCPDALDAHSGTGEDLAFIDIEAGKDDQCICGLFNKRLGIVVKISFNKTQMPWMSNWQHWGKNDYVTGLEPGTHPPIGQAMARKKKVLIELKPGESRIYDLRMEVLSDPQAIDEFMKDSKSAVKNPLH